MMMADERKIFGLPIVIDETMPDGFIKLDSTTPEKQTVYFLGNVVGPIPNLPADRPILTSR